MSTKEAQARIKINKLLKTSGWRFFDADFSLFPTKMRTRWLFI